MNRISQSTRRLVLLAMLSALILVLSFTPIGYLKIGPLSITFLSIPVAVGAVMEGVGAGALLGFVFGLSSLLQCFGMEPFGTTLFGISPVRTIIMCLVPRILCGILSALVFKLFEKKEHRRTGGFVASFTAAFANTVLFLTALVLLFRNSYYADMAPKEIWGILAGIVSLNSIVEALCATAVGGAICAVLLHLYKRG